VEAVERVGGDPAQSLVALRSYNRMLILTRRGGFTTAELERIRAFANERFFDMVYAPDVRAEEVNQYNVLESPAYYEAFTGFLEAEDRDAWLAVYPYDVTPPADNHPFFGHYFRWQQAPEVLAMAGHVWQPFGGAGYLVLLALLVVATVSAALLVLLPLVRVRGQRGERARSRPARAWLGLATFGFLGLAYLFVEIPLLQRFILFLGHPTYAMATVLGALLLFSGVGSLVSDRVRLGPAVGALVALVVIYRFLALRLLSGPLLGLPLMARFAVAIGGLAPLGLLMGIPFPRSLSLLNKRAPGLTSWAWGINGALSVVASVLASILALSWGFGSVLMLGAVCYLGAWVTTAWAIRSLRPRDGTQRPPQ
jgi:hypothetical protein